jgi:hypothetical protein
MSLKSLSFVAAPQAALVMAFKQSFGHGPQTALVMNLKQLWS